MSLSELLMYAAVTQMLLWTTGSMGLLVLGVVLNKGIFWMEKVALYSTAIIPFTLIFLGSLVVTGVSSYYGYNVLLFASLMSSFMLFSMTYIGVLLFREAKGERKRAEDLDKENRERLKNMTEQLGALAEMFGDHTLTNMPVRPDTPQA